jgi:hypothetical protein
MSLLAEAINSRIPTFLARAMIHLPTPTFKAIRRARYLADELGIRAIREKKTAARQGLEVDTNIYGRLCEYICGRTENLINTLQCNHSMSLLR